MAYSKPNKTETLKTITADVVKVTSGKGFGKKIIWRFGGLVIGHIGWDKGNLQAKGFAVPVQENYFENWSDAELWFEENVLEIFFMLF